MRLHIVLRPRAAAALAFALFALAANDLARATDFTFFLTGDTHYGQDLLQANSPGDKATINRMNNLPGTPYPASIGGVVGTPLGVLVAGDLTDTPDIGNFYGIHLGVVEREGFNDDFASTGAARSTTRSTRDTATTTWTAPTTATRWTG